MLYYCAYCEFIYTKDINIHSFSYTGLWKKLSVCQADVSAGGVQLWQTAITDTGRNHTKRQRPVTSPWGDGRRGSSRKKGGSRERERVNASVFSWITPSLFTHNDWLCVVKGPVKVSERSWPLLKRPNMTACLCQDGSLQDEIHPPPNLHSTTTLHVMI